MPRLEEEPRYRLAVNLFDLDRVDPFIRTSLELARKLDTSAIIRVDKDRPDEVGVAFKTEGISLLTAASICDIIRTHDAKVGNYPLRVYLKNGTGDWVRLTGKVTLTLVSRGSIILNPKVFTATVKLARIEPPEIKVQEF